VARTSSESAQSYSSIRLGLGQEGQPSLIWEHSGYGPFGLDHRQGTLRLIKPGVEVLCSWTSNGAWQPPSLADSAALNNALDFSTTANKLGYKDAGGVVNNLY
jgi:hypothetical protein